MHLQDNPLDRPSALAFQAVGGLGAGELFAGRHACWFGNGVEPQALIAVDRFEHLYELFIVG